MQKVIHEYVRERVPGRGGKEIVGVIAGTVQRDKIVIGWSKNNWKEGDIFDKKYGINLAVKRAKGREKSPDLPIQMEDQMREFQNRCIRYFQQAKSLKLR